MPYLEVNVLACRHVFEMHFQDLLSSLDIRVGHCDMAVKATGSDKGFVEGLWEVGGCYTDDSITGLESAIHLVIDTSASQHHILGRCIQPESVSSRLFCLSNFADHRPMCVHYAHVVSKPCKHFGTGDSAFSIYGALPMVLT